MKKCKDCDFPCNDDFEICPICGKNLDDESLVYQKQNNNGALLNMGDANAIAGDVNVVGTSNPKQGDSNPLLNMGDANAIAGDVKVEGSPNPKQVGTNPVLSMGDANAINGGINISLGTGYAQQKSDVQILSEKKLQYRKCCEEKLSDGILTYDERRWLEKKRSELDLSKDIAEMILNEVKVQSHNAPREVIPNVHKLRLDKLKGNIESNNVDYVKQNITWLKNLADIYQNDELQYLCYMAMAAVNPKECVKAYCDRKDDKYWHTFWSYLAFLKLEDKQNAESVLLELDSWSNYMPEDNQKILASLGEFVNGDEECAKTIMQQIGNDYSQIITPLYMVLSSLINYNHNDSEIKSVIDRYSFYVDNFFNKVLEDKMQEGESCALKKYKWGKYCYDNKKYGEAVKLFRELAELGYADAQNVLGFCYDMGNGVSRDYKEAVKLYRKSAEQGNASAQNNLGYCYSKGNGVPQDYKKAVEWYRKSARQGNASAQNNLGNCYYKGNGVPQDYKEAVIWYQKSAEQGFSSAQYNLGICYEKGRGVDSKNVSEAKKWYKKAGLQGSENAKQRLKNLGS